MMQQAMPMEAQFADLGPSPNLSSDDDAFWVAKAKQGDPEAFRVLVDLHGRKLFRLAFRMTGREDLADDVVQEAFLKAYRSLHRFDGRSRFSTWLHRIGANCAVDLLRRQKGREISLSDSPVEGSGQVASSPLAAEPPSQAPGPERLALSGEIERRLGEALDSLTPVERAAFVLRHFENQSIAEIGRTLGSRTSATKQAVFRAVRKLRRQLEPFVGSTGSQVPLEGKEQDHADPR